MSGGQPWPEHLLADLIACGGDRELFRIVVERLADLFEPGLCRVYAELFSEVIARRTGLHADHLVARYERIRRPRALDRDPNSIENVFVLSRVTLGADVAGDQRHSGCRETALSQRIDLVHRSPEKLGAVRCRSAPAASSDRLWTRRNHR